ncbi:MAG: hypothetical protein LC808_08825 [Actinobacteria bacterium]|nr:hypothetical protein [Actinomycetota bacterium]
MASELLAAHLGTPREAARLLMMVRHPFEEWRGFVREVRAAVAALLSDRSQTFDSEVLLRALEDRLYRWAADWGIEADELNAEAVATRVLRARCRRLRNDFVGASQLLAEVDRGVLDDDERLIAAMEWAMAVAEVRGLEELSFPPKAHRSHLVDRLKRAESYLHEVVDRDPKNREASLMLGMLAYFQGHDAVAARLFTTVVDGLYDDPRYRELARAVTFHRSVSQLRELHAGTDEGAYRDAVKAIEDGYVPTEDELVSATVALQAHGSPHAGAFLDRAVALAPRSAAVGKIVLELARKGDSTAVALAADMAQNDKRPGIERAALLDAALAGAEAHGDARTISRLVPLIEDVIARANRPALDERWARSLGSNETLRAVLEPATADAMRIEVLRRIGDVDEARSLARGLFHRAAAGAIRSLDAADLHELLRELGLEQDQLDELARLLHDEPPVAEVQEEGQPRTIHEAVEWGAARFPHLVFLDGAYASARRSPYRQVGRVWKALAALEEATTAWEAGGLEGGFRQALGAKGLDYARAVSAATAGRYPHEYERTYEGRRIRLGPHVRLGRGSPEACCRIYLYLDEVRRVCVVGHVGAHLSDKTTG